MQVKESVEQRFSELAARYAQSPIHRGGPDLEALLAQAIRSGEERCLDVGCGPGCTALALAERGGHAVGVDLSEAMLEQARRAAAERGVRNVEFRRGDVEALPFPDASFDVVASRFSAHHYADPRRAVCEMARVLRRDGALLLLDSIAPEEPAFDSYLNALEVLRDPSHVRNHRISEWLGLFAGAGLRAGVVETFPLRLGFRAWLERQAAPPEAEAAIRSLRARAPAQVRSALGWEESGDFTLPTALLLGRK